MTLGAWVKPDTVDGNSRTVLLKEWNGDFLAYDISTGDGGKPFGAAYMSDDESLALAEAPNALEEDTWTHLAMTRQADRRRARLRSRPRGDRNPRRQGHSNLDDRERRPA